MPGWLKFTRKGRAAARPLQGVQPARRVKHYAAMSGYAYEYVYEGWRMEAAVREHVFQVTADNKEWFTVVVGVPERAVAEWERGHEREMGEAARYAIAKLALFEAFDERDTPNAMRVPSTVTAAQLARLLESIDF